MPILGNKFEELQFQKHHRLHPVKNNDKFFFARLFAIHPHASMLKTLPPKEIYL